MGNRSILANPSSQKVNDTLNHRLKRSEFMPFAPVVLRSHYEKIFQSSKLDGAAISCRYMTITLDVTTEWKIKVAGVVHVDGTARPQIIEKEDNPLYFGILEEFYNLTSTPSLVNTSFNLHEEPIVNSPVDALNAFEQGAIDLLVLNDYLVWSSKFHSPEQLMNDG
jgi:carbamoyltransferase